MNQENLKRLIELMSEVKIGLIAVNNYINVDGEMSKRRINIGYSYAKMKKVDLKTLKNMLRTGSGYIASDKYTKADWDIAVLELIEGIVNPNPNRSKGQKDAYLILTENGAVKYNYNTQELYIEGVELDGSKKVVEEGTRKVVKSAPKTIAKNKIRSEYLKSGLIRNFKVKEIREIKMRGEELELC